MKNTAKTFKRVLPCVLGLGISALSILAPLGGLKKANADYLPPASGDYFPTIPSMYGYNISFSLPSYGENGYSTNVSVSLSYDNGQNPIYQYNDTFPVYQSINPDTTIYTRYDLRNENYTGNMWITAKYELGDIYLNEQLYEHIFGGCSLTLGGATSYEFAPIYCVATWGLVVYNLDTGLFQETTYNQTLASDTRLCEFRALSWEEFYSAYGFRGFVMVRSFNVEFTTRVTNFNDYVSYTLNHLSTPIETDYYRQVQKSGFIEWSPYSWRTATSIGLDTVSDGVSSFLNMEFIPGFKLWYFLLIGLGCAITGIALKFFLGG